MTASVILGAIALILLVIFGVTVTVLVSGALSSAFRALDSMHVRSIEQQNKLLDRLMTIRWEDYVAVRDSEDTEDGRFIAPGDDEEEKEEIIPLRWGALREEMRPTTDEEELLREDFPEEMGDSA